MKKLFDKIKENKSFIVPWIVLGISLVIFASGLTYAYFDFSIDSSEESSLKITATDFEVNLVGNTLISGTNVAPIFDEYKSTQANTFNFSVKNNSRKLSGCYILSLKFSSINDALVSKYMKWELTNNTNSSLITGTFEKIKNNTLILRTQDNIGLNEEISYTLKIWLSYSLTENQNDMMNTSWSATVVLDSRSDCLGEYEKDGLIVWYDGINNAGFSHLNDTALWKDISENGNDGVLNGGTWGTNYLSFDGIDDWVSIGELNYNKYTIEVVTKPTTYTTSERIIIGNYQLGGYGLETSAGNFRNMAYISSEYKAATGTTSYIANTNYSIVGTYDENNLKLYVNGFLISENPAIGTIVSPEINTIMAVGANPYKDTATGNWYEGYVYSVRIYNRALTAEEVAKNYAVDEVRFGIR